MARQGELGLLCGWEGAAFGFCRACSCVPGSGKEGTPLLPGAVVPWRHFCLVPGHTAGCTLSTLTSAALMGHCSLDSFPRHTVQLKEHHCVFRGLKSAEDAAFFFQLIFMHYQNF